MQGLARKKDKIVYFVLENISGYGAKQKFPSGLVYGLGRD